MADERDQEEPSGRWLPPEPPGDGPLESSPRPPLPQPPASPQPPPAYQPQPPRGYPPAPPHYPPVYAPQPPNNDAVAGFTCAITGLTLLFFTAGLATIVSLILGIVAIPFSRKGKRAIAEGRTQKHKDLAKAGYVIGIVTVVLSILATTVWGLLIAFADWEDDDGYDYSDPDEFQFQVVLRLLAAAARLIG